MALTFTEYRARRIVNIHKHVDGPWFWGRYSAHPYIGCSSGCEFCYARSGSYSGGRDPTAFDREIRVKVNAVELLRKELPKLAPEVIGAGDWQQPAEGRYQLSREMLKVIHEYGFPLFVVERSPLLTRDLDLLVEINRKSWVGVLFSISSLDSALKRAFEPRSPGTLQRLKAMARLAAAGILVGTAMMPLIPVAGDDQQHIEELVRATRDHGGSCIVGGGMTMDGVQAERSLAAAARLDPALVGKWRELYRWPPGARPNLSPPGPYNARVGLLIRELCAKHGLLDRMPRYVAPGPLAINKRLAERLFLRTYDLELEQAGDYRIWAYRKAAWTVDEYPGSISDLYSAEGEAALLRLPGIGRSIAAQLASWLQIGGIAAGRGCGASGTS